MKKAGRSEAHRRLEERFQEALERSRQRRRKRAVLARPPRCDEVYRQGAAWIDRLAVTDEWPLEGGES